jgi:hypothetical protein
LKGKISSSLSMATTTESFSQVKGTGDIMVEKPSVTVTISPAPSHDAETLKRMQAKAIRRFLVRLREIEGSECHRQGVASEPNMDKAVEK